MEGSSIFSFTIFPFLCLALPATLLNDLCAKVDFKVFDKYVANSNTTTLSVGKGKCFLIQNVSRVSKVSTENKCHLTLCDDEMRMGYCIQFLPAANVVENDFKGILQSTLVGIDCQCGGTIENGVPYTDSKFDRNYVGVVYSPYDKYWEPTGPNGKLEKVPFTNYNESELMHSLKQVSQKFTNIATYDMGSTVNTKTWKETLIMGFVPFVSSKINQERGYLSLRVAVGTRINETFLGIDAAKEANKRFNGTVWGITVTSQYVINATRALQVIDRIKEVRSINAKEKLKLKVGIRLHSDQCYQFPIIYDNLNATATTDGNATLTDLQTCLYEIAQICDYILCGCGIPPTWEFMSISDVIEDMQKKYINLRNTLQNLNPNLTLIIETGAPSQGVGNGRTNTIQNLLQYWKRMAEFSKRERIKFHLFEAIDQPYKSDLAGSDLDSSQAHAGWWKRKNSLNPAIYVEKISEIPENHGEDFTITIVLVCFAVFIVGTVFTVAYLYRKFDKARKQIISQVYVDQFHSGGGDCNGTETYYAVALKIPYDKKYELDKSSFTIDKSRTLGSGQSGTVCIGSIQMSGHIVSVAFKYTTPQCSVGDIKAMMSEIKILSFLGQHENLVCILGAYTKKIHRGIVYVALEYCELGSAESFLRNAVIKEFENPSSISSESSVYFESHIDIGYKTAEANKFYKADDTYPYHHSSSCPRVPYVTTVDSSSFLRDGNGNRHFVTTQMLLAWSQQIASAMEYVSEKNVVHGDLAARNVLLASVHQIKVSDFGLSRKIYQELGVTHDKDTPLPWRWMAPESLKHLAFSKQSDVWGYAVTIWEIFSLAEVPYHGTSFDMSFVDKLFDGMRLPKAICATTELHDELEKCWNMNPSSRPNFTELKEFFSELIKDKEFQSTNM